jgi:hypothetical protein
MRNWVIGALLVLLGIAAYYYFNVYQVAEPEAISSAPVAAVTAGPDPEPLPIPAKRERVVESEPELEPITPPPAEEIPIPTLMDSDPVVLETLGGLIGESAVIQYLVSDNVIARIVATVDTMGSRQIPGVVQVVQGPESPFEANVDFEPETLIHNQEGDLIPQFVIDPVNYKRYTPYVELLEAADSASLVEIYRSYDPLFQEAYRQMGYASGDFDQRLIAVIDELLATPVVTDPVNLLKPEAVFVFTDPDLESLSAGQKILLRMGNANATRTKLKLSEIRDAL